MAERDNDRFSSKSPPHHLFQSGCQGTADALVKCHLFFKDYFYSYFPQNLKA
jgi:hypothetical protein